MNTRHEIEARLERSLRNQVQAPELDRRFDAAVWARIDSEAHAPRRATAPEKAASRAALWLRASNVVGVLVALTLVIYFGLRPVSGMEIEVSLPTLSAHHREELGRAAIWGITGAALIFGVLFTPLARRLRSALG